MDMLRSLTKRYISIHFIVVTDASIRFRIVRMLQISRENDVCLKVTTFFISKIKSIRKRETPDSNRILKIKVMSRLTFF